MLDHEEEEAHAVLAQFPLHHGKAMVMLDKGFQRGTYGVTVEYGELAAAKGFRSAAHKARNDVWQLRQQLAQFRGHELGTTDDPSRNAAPGRRRDLESTFLYFTLTYADGRWHDREMTERFRTAMLRASQAQEQDQARAQTRRCEIRQGQFRQKLEDLLGGDAYSALDAVTKERLTQDVLLLAFPPRDLER
jgi:hypothetical protein